MDIKKLGLVVIPFILSACSNHSDNTIYYWGNYDDVVYSYYNGNENYDEQSNMLMNIITQAKAKNKQVAPGVYGQLGLVKIKQGQLAQAREAFQQEQLLYPESTRFMQFLQKLK
ncbi:DUF4810 domain-containing protein [Pasteurellaceae bacterium LIM206]|nr:DUF4810 domain-containing protein [Pasteurellaceae bacterium LIM206]